MRLRFYPLKNFANANVLLHFSSVEICVSVLRLIQRNFGGGGIQMLSGEQLQLLPVEVNSIEISASIAVRLHLYPLENFANANWLLNFYFR